MPLQATSGAASYDAFGGGVPVVPNYIEDVFSTYLYTGNDTVQTITNGIDLSTKGGAVFIKSRNLTSPTVVYDTNRGINKALCTNLTNAENVGTLGTNQDLNSFNTNGFAVNLFTNAGGGFGINNSAHNLASWTFRKQPKFFDVVTWTGSNDSGTSIGQGIVPHNLGSAPGCVIIKNVTQGSTNWIVYHRSLSGGYRMLLNTTDAQTNSGSAAYFSKYVNGVGWTQTDPDANNIYVGYNYQTNGNGDTLVAYLFAHNAGGFGLTGTDNVISCGSFTTDAFGDPTTVNLGYEPQWVLLKSAASAASWFILDNMRGWSNSSSSKSMTLLPNTSGAEAFGTVGADNLGSPTATGFTIKGVNAADTMIYIAIRRGPMKVPTSGTSVFSPVARAGTSATATVTAGFPVDMTIIQDRTQNSFAAPFDRLRGATNRLFTPFTAAEASEPTTLTSFAVQDGFTLGTDLGAGFVNTSGDNYINWNFRRAPSFFDEVCYTGTGASSQVLTHNLTVTPQLTIFKKRSASNPWDVVYGNTSYLQLNDTLQAFPDTSIAATATTITAPLGAGNGLNASGATYVAYLFATCAGVSKVGSYTGNGTTQTINCGFTSGARFVMIKATSTTGNWIVADSARGIVAGNDPALYLNSTAAEVTGLDWIDADNSGFVVNETATIAANTNGVSYIFFAVA